MSKTYIFNNIIGNIRNNASLGHQNIFDTVADLGKALRGPSLFKECITKQRNQAIKNQICSPFFLEFSYWTSVPF